MRVPAGIEEAVLDLLCPDLQRLKKLAGFVACQLDPRGAKFVARWPVGPSSMRGIPGSCGRFGGHSRTLAPASDQRFWPVVAGAFSGVTRILGPRQAEVQPVR